MDSSTDNRGGGGGHHSAADPPRLCARGCGFFGSPETRGLCSMCYKDYLRENKAKSEETAALIVDKLGDAFKSAKITEIDGDNNHKDDNHKPSPVNCGTRVNRCGLCRKKLGLLGFECRCGGNFCGVHRYAEAHSCKVDYKKAGRIAIQKENPVCTTDKMRDRV